MAKREFTPVFAAQTSESDTPRAHLSVPSQNNKVVVNVGENVQPEIVKLRQQIGELHVRVRSLESAMESLAGTESIMRAVEALNIAERYFKQLMNLGLKDGNVVQIFLHLVRSDGQALKWRDAWNQVRQQYPEVGDEGTLELWGQLSEHLALWAQTPGRSVRNSEIADLQKDLLTVAMSTLGFNDDGDDRSELLNATSQLSALIGKVLALHCALDAGPRPLPRM